MVMGLRRIQAGKETTRGTAVAADTILLGRLTYTPNLGLYMPEDEERNSLALLHRRTIVAQHATMRYEGSATFEQVPIWLSMALKGGVTPTNPGTGEAKLWTFTPSLTAVNTQDSWTVEYGDNQQEYESAFVVASQLEFTLAMGQVVTLGADLFGKFPSKSTFTASLTAPTVEDVVATKAKLWIDSTWAGLGTTQVSNTLINAVVRIPTGVAMTRYADGSLEFSSVSEGKRAAEVELTYKHNASGVTEYDKYVDGSLRFIRIQSDGSAFASPDNGLNRFLRLDLAVRYTEAPELFGEQDGEDVIRLVGRTFHDPTNNTDMSIAVQNNVTAL